MKCTLYYRDDELLKSRVTACLENGVLYVTGQDSGPEVEKFFGYDEYDYMLSLSRDDTAKFFQALGCEGLPEKTQMDIMWRRFSGVAPISAIMQYCDEYGIQTTVWDENR